MRPRYHSTETGRTRYASDLFFALQDLGFHVEVCDVAVSRRPAAAPRLALGAALSSARLASRKNKLKVQQHIEEFEGRIVMIDSIGCWPLVRGLLGSRVLYYSSHNAENELLQGISRARLAWNTTRELALENEVCARADVISAITKYGAEQLSIHGAEVIVIPPAIALEVVDADIPVLEVPGVVIYCSMVWSRKRREAERFLSSHARQFSNMSSSGIEFNCIGAMGGHTRQRLERRFAWLSVASNVSDPIVHLRGRDVVLPEREFPGFPLRLFDIAAAGSMLVAPVSLSNHTDLLPMVHYYPVDEYVERLASIEPETRYRIAVEYKKELNRRFGADQRRSVFRLLAEALKQ